MKENQTVEWKVHWRDDYIKWLCGFANADGGILEIGRADDGTVVGVSNADKLLEDLPNKIRDVLGIMVAVNLVKEDGKDLIRIIVEPYPSPISYKGQYHYRSGSTKQELKGPALEQFLLKKRGRTWDAVPLPELQEHDLDPAALNRFRSLARDNGRVDAEALTGSDTLLLERLNLHEGEYLKRAAALLFANDPERFVMGAAVKIGYFRSATDVGFHDTISGDLLGVAQQTLDTLHLKYLKAAITYQDIQRIETYPVPRAALREALLNALVHRDYAMGAPIQIRVYDDRLSIWNAATLPDGWTAEKLLADHPSRPFNPSIASVVFRAGEIETWGRGIQRIVEACREAKIPEPILSCETGELKIEFPFAAAYMEALQGSEARSESPRKASEMVEKEIGIGKERGGNFGKISERIRKEFGTGPAEAFGIISRHPEYTAEQIADALKKTPRTVENYVAKLKKSGAIVRVGPKLGGHWEIVE